MPWRITTCAITNNIIETGYKDLESQREREQAQARQDAERLKNDPAALKQELNAQATDLARKDLEQQMASQADQLRDKLASDAALRAEVGDLLDYRERLSGAAANVAGGAKAIGEMLEPSVWDLLSPAAKAVKLGMIVAALKGGAAEFKIGSQVAGELATIEQLSGKLNDLNAGKLPGEAELSKYYDKTPLGQAISEARATGSGGAKTNLEGYPTLARPNQTTPGNVILGDLDSLGRPTGVTAVLKPETLGGGSSANPAIRPPGFEGQGANHARGHLLANSLGGAGDDARNLVTLFQRNANHPNMSSFERQVKAAIQNGETVSYRAIPIYKGSDPIPTGVTLTARGSGGFNLDVSIPNINGVR
ncbi:DNA/RNA non-specific endonuclease [Pseudomonas oryzihabitans]|uniref:DNA/RNA non-specific endonuclease n=1 Tax=Pseudomonas oryzihabitans TaxID=47885 RepID=UPI001120BF19|nr:DNA/RNA non-specific endonuclease [Pseudomonas psychrotolerans]QDD88201.1 hypothetical protein CCZ28_03970 [Pseudomonas psychrotolerans]